MVELLPVPPATTTWTILSIESLCAFIRAQHLVTLKIQNSANLLENHKRIQPAGLHVCTLHFKIYVEVGGTITGGLCHLSRLLKSSRTPLA
jgi:hypothetical protein